ncbi:MAG: DUF4276 family protein [Anaerolineae bacterium]|nr:DUF4276 family protein [Anaerolineae bacterium]
MPSVRIWAVESDYDAEAVKHLARKLVVHFGLNLSIQSAGKRAFNGVATPRRGEDGLEKAVELYLKQDDCVIFVIDYDNLSMLEERRRQTKSLISRLEKVTTGRLAGRVHLAWAVQELEAWFLVDGVGLCCYFTGGDNQAGPRQQRAKKFQSLLKKILKNTELVVGTAAKDKGAKEYLIELSEKILKSHNPKIEQRIITQKKYTESLSPEIANYIEINDDNLKRNASLQRFGEYLMGCRKAE